MEKKHAIECLEKLTGWAKRKGYQVCFSQDNDDEIVFEDKTINIMTRTTFENRVYSLLHECGHLIEYSNNSKKYQRKYPLSERILSDGRSQYSIEGRVETVEEEISAWRHGEKLATILGLKIDRKRYRKYAASNLIQYIDWAADRGPRSPETLKKKDLDKPWKI